MLVLRLQGVVGLRGLEMSGRVVRAADRAGGRTGVAERECGEGWGGERFGERDVVEEVLGRDVRVDGFAGEVGRVGARY